VTPEPRLVRVRISGPPGAVAQVADELRRWLPVAEESGDYPNRRNPGVRRYLSVLLTGEGRTDG
jgi:hypothetical protein